MSISHANDELFMGRALEVARRAWGNTHPNPRGGAVIVENGEIVAEGWHRKAGTSHAEIVALDTLGRRPSEDAVLYVTLEPCSTCGHTGACTEAIIAAGISHVVVGAEDPNPKHAGRGLERLRAAGVRVRSGISADLCTDLNLIFNHWITEGTPLLSAKMALTLDGKFASASGQSRWVTSNFSRTNVMLWRRYFPAIGVGANTVLQDDPTLTSRIGEEVWCPTRFVFDRELKTLDANKCPQLYSDHYADSTVILCSEKSALRAGKKTDVCLWPLPESEGHLDWKAFRKRCVEEEIYGVYIETGPKLATAVIENYLVDYLFIYQAPKLMCDSGSLGLGSLRNSRSMNEVFAFKEPQFIRLGEDLLTRGFIE
ncbi:MAG: bifunctional diaminohydroxyphosphoribosylaminopyrimidine deaminase/5-amino-6-(5-phosphoribosylamino)uracil reductase RibD [Verrucomicrobiota bacterium]|nr:bifunctional diaminohydroxyphosphoribosylaminopyrimidine deaminase/5-amino-6-(5-phosphoribosylamino)uracil reductase RibD [Verrucomicrobiota bacterium]